MAQLNRSFLVFQTRGEAVSFISFAVITGLIGTALGTIGLLLTARPQMVLVTIGFGLVASLVPIVVDTLFSRREFAHVAIEQHNDVLAQICNLKEEAIREARAVRRRTLAPTSNERMGLECAFLDESDPDCLELLKNLIEDPKVLTVMMNYSPNWIKSHNRSFSRRFEDPQKITTFIFMDPRTEAFMVQARKQGREVSRLQEKLVEAIDTIRELGGLEVRILGHKHFHVQHLILGDQQAAVCSFYSAGEKQPSPVFFYSNTEADEDMHKRLREDVRGVERTVSPLDDWYNDFVKRHPRQIDV